jgi:serine/threonine-protein kinase
MVTPVETTILPPRYRSPKLIGEGGMGEIYRATDDVLGRAVAVKVLAERFAKNEAIRQRFTREALAAARLSGEPSTVTIFDVGEWSDRPFIVMEYLGGGSLDDRLRADGPESPGQALDWLEQAALALDAAHRNGVVHRDVKPGNLLLDRAGNVHVADFGIASAAGMDSLTLTGTVLGTAGYLAPEQAQGERATPASDRYGLAVVAYELLTGVRPFQNDSPTAEAAAHVHAPVPSVCDRRETLPCELDPVFDRALAKDPSERYPTCAEFVAALRDAVSEAAGKTGELAPTAPAPAFDGHARPAPRVPNEAPPPVAAPVRHRRSPARGAALIALLVAAAVAGAIIATVVGNGGGKKSAAHPKRPAPTHTRPAPKQHATTTAAPSVSTPSVSTPTATAPAPTASVPVSGDAHSLNDRGYALIGQGDYNGALPLLQSAVQKLHGAGPGDVYEGYANYNLGYALLQLGRCHEATGYLQRAVALEPSRSEPRSALARARSC